MSTIENPFKRWLAARRRPAPLGTWLMSSAPSTAEAMGLCGFDFLVADLEHVPVEIPELVNILRAAGCTPAQVVVRLAWNDQVMIKRALDAGARTVMLPFIQNEEEARAAVSYAQYPPLGVRGVAAMHRGSLYGRAPDYLKRANDETAIILQLETPEAIERAGAIAAVPGVDALFVGPGDLSAAMGHIGNIGHPEVQAMIARAAQDCHAAGKPVGIVGPNPEMVQRFLDYGYDFAAIGSDLAMMIGRAGEWLGALRSGAAPAADAQPGASY
jgi:2-dehydro-3-deoxyglucarate aldolase/4-hydroxy-2-oxoheptanedioate aldolase